MSINTLIILQRTWAMPSYAVHQQSIPFLPECISEFPASELSLCTPARQFPRNPHHFKPQKYPYLLFRKRLQFRLVIFHYLFLARTNILSYLCSRLTDN